MPRLTDVSPSWVSSPRVKGMLRGGGLTGIASGYYQKVLATQPANLIAYWPLWETAGAVANDISGNGRNGTYTGITLGQTGIGDGRTCSLFDGATSYVNLFSAGLAAGFNGAEGTAAIWGRVLNAGIWADGTTDFLFYLYGPNANNRIMFQKTGGILALSYIAGGVNRTRNGSTTPTAFFHAAITWSAVANEVLHYWNGAVLGAALAPGVWAGALTQALIGSNVGVPPAAFPWNGWAAHAALWDVALTPAEVATLATVP
jgi:hypothetical protein